MNTPRRTNSAEASAAVLRRRMVQRPEHAGFRQRMYDIIFEADCSAGRAFDVGLLIAIIASITLVSLETLPAYRGMDATVIEGEAAARAMPDDANIPFWLIAGEWFLTILFTIEYVARLSCVRHPMRYATSFWGVVDLLSILPSYLVFFFASARSFAILRSIRLLRVFRVLKLWRMMSQADELADAVWHSRDKIVVFLSVVLVAVTISGTLMYHIETVLTENEIESDFTSIPQAMYWAIVTMTTVGYGDIVPHTTIGKIISAILILLGYSLIIVPTGFVSAELSSRNVGPEHDLHPCPNCGVSRHRRDADYCYRCGAHLENHSPDEA
ncbi:ion transporter [Rhodopirellula sallentina]|uniref:Potassium channel protein n=1 Tax=Rhodopirellula sallentina SM41 TaxID=1263870 RepID=M5TYZ1_9BACT|nr:ion transporter [Rhodopirellula sallentina]EMI54437.1 potassium channel protein [Rhodopirellula sallentina SM41]